MILYPVDQSHGRTLIPTLELRGTNVHVTALCPGYTYSEFHDVQGTRDKMNRLPRFMWMNSDKVVRQGLQAAERGKPVHINGLVNRRPLSRPSIFDGS